MCKAVHGQVKKSGKHFLFLFFTLSPCYIPRRGIYPPSSPIYSLTWRGLLTLQATSLRYGDYSLAPSKRRVITKKKEWEGRRETERERTKPKKLETPTHGARGVPEDRRLAHYKKAVFFFGAYVRHPVYNIYIYHTLATMPQKLVTQNTH